MISPPEKISRVLVVRWESRLGNLLFITPILANLKKQLPGARIEILVSQRYADVFLRNPDVDEILTLPSGTCALLHLPRLISILRRKSYDVAMDASHMHSFSFSNALLTFLSDAGFRIGFDRGAAGRFYHTAAPPAPEGLPVTQQYLTLLSTLGLSTKSYPTKCVLSPGETTWARQKIEDLGKKEGEKLIGICLGLLRRSPGWGLLHLRQLACELLEKKSARLLILPGPQELIAAKTARWPKNERLNLMPVFPLRQFAAILSRCDLVIAGDTGPLHLAAACGTKTLAIFLEHRSMVNKPLGSQHRMIFQEQADTGPVARTACEMLSL